MLLKINRLDKKTIEKIFKYGKFIGFGSISFKYILEKGLPSRVSFITPKTISKKATTRNLLRRRGYGILKDKFGQIPLGTAGAFIFSKDSLAKFGGRKSKQHNPAQNLDYEITKILNKIN
ncbi:MAG: ribonuclease P protein component [Candidatus Paceibacterota bacterium]